MVLPLRRFLRAVSAELVQPLRAVVASLPAIELHFTFGDGPTKGSSAFLVGLHAPDGIADDFRRVAVKAACDFPFNVVLHFRREIDMHGHRAALRSYAHRISITWIPVNHARHLPDLPNLGVPTRGRRPLTSVKGKAGAGKAGLP